MKVNINFELSSDFEQGFKYYLINFCPIYLFIYFLYRFNYAALENKYELKSCIHFMHFKVGSALLCSLLIGQWAGQLPSSSKADLRLNALFKFLLLLLLTLLLLLLLMRTWRMNNLASGIQLIENVGADVGRGWVWVWV